MNKIIKPYFNSQLDSKKTQGLIAFYDATTQQGGGYFADKIGNRHGTFVSSPTWQDGNSICTNNTDQYISIAGLNTQSWTFPFSLSALMACDTLTSNRVWMGWLCSSSNYYYTWSLSSTRINLTRNGSLYGIDRALISEGKIFNLTVVYNSATSINAYLNGVDCTISGNDSWEHNSQNLTIGCRYYNAAQYFSDIRIQQLAIFNRALNLGEILSLYQDQYYLYKKPEIYGFKLSGTTQSKAFMNYYRGLM